MLRTIAGRNNESVKLARKLMKKKYRRERALFVSEGLDLLRVAVDVGEFPVEVLVREDLVPLLPAELIAAAREDEVDIGVCDRDTLGSASSLGGAVDVVAVYELPDFGLADLLLSQGVTVYLAGLGDPGNVGTIIRAAAAFGAVGVVCSPATADPFGPKAIRAGMGAQFMVRVVLEVTPEQLEAKLAADETRGLRAPTLVVADVRGGVTARSLREADAPESPGGEAAGSRRVGDGGVVLAMGPERGEVPAFSRPTLSVAIPQDRFDSLNVAMAATILLYELAGPGPGEGAIGASV